MKEEMRKRQQHWLRRKYENTKKGEVEVEEEELEFNHASNNVISNTGITFCATCEKAATSAASCPTCKQQISSKLCTLSSFLLVLYVLILTFLWSSSWGWSSLILLSLSSSSKVVISDICWCSSAGPHSPLTINTSHCACSRQYLQEINFQFLQYCSSIYFEVLPTKSLDSLDMPRLPGRNPIIFPIKMKHT